MFRSLSVATLCHRLSTHCSPVPLPARLLSAYCSHVCLHYCAHPAYCLGFSPCAHHDLSFSPSVCHPGHLRYHQSLTRVHSHSLPVPPPLPLADARSQGGSTVGRSRSLACGPVVRLSLVVPLAGESPLADARLPPHPNGHLLLAKRSPTHHAPLLASTPLYAYMSAFLHPCLPPVLSTPCLQYFIQSCQHDAACIVHQIRQSPQPQFSIYAHIEGAQRASVSEYQAHVCIYACVNMMPELRSSERQRARPSPARARLVTSGYFD